MSNAQSNAAQQQPPSPELEVVEGTASFVQPGEIEAVLDSMAKQEAEAANTAPAQISATEPAKVADEPVEEPSGEKPPGDGQPSIEEAALPGPAPDVPSSGPSFTMEDVLRAAAESTSFSVDEIKNFEPEEAELAPGGEPGTDDVAYGEPFNVPEDPHSLGDGWAEESRDVSEEEAPAVRRALRSVPLPRSWAPIRSWLATGIAAAAALGVAISLWRIGGVEAQAASRAANLEKSSAEILESVEGLNERVARLDRALSAPTSARDVEHPAVPDRAGHTEPDELPVHGEKADSHGVPPTGSHDGLHEQGKNSPETRKQPALPADGPAKKTPAVTRSPIGVSAGSQIEGFRGIRRPAPPRKPKIVLRARRTANRAPSAPARVRAYLNGRPVAPAR